jgi:chromosome segregation ATPase
MPTTTEQLQEQVERLEAQHRAAVRQAERVRGKLDPTSGLHIKAETGDQAAAAERRRLRSELASLDRKALELESDLRQARYARSRAEDLAREDERERRNEERAEHREMVRRATEHKERLERELGQHLADLGWYGQPNGPLRTELEQRAIQYIRDVYGEGSAQFAHDYLLPRLGQDSGVYSGPAGDGAPMAGPAWRIPGDPGAA